MLLNRAKLNIMQKRQKELKEKESKELQQKIKELQDEDPAFQSNNYWKKPSMFSEDDLLKELEDFE